MGSITFSAQLAIFSDLWGCQTGYGAGGVSTSLGVGDQLIKCSTHPKYIQLTP